MKPEPMSDDEEGGLRSVRKPPRPAISASVVSDLTPKTAELAHKRVACARKICTTIDHVLYHCPMQCTPKPDVSHRKIEERCLPREDEWSAMTHPGWQVQQEALTISQQAPCGTQRRRAARSHQLRKQSWETGSAVFRIKPGVWKLWRKAQQRGSVEVGRIVRRIASTSKSYCESNAIFGFWNERSSRCCDKRLRKQRWRRRLCGQSRRL